ncbi:hypothetical protein KVR01_013058 [Diaporthe batatas]|uniref:uncharacterized protein n=1 Tax=Diaporthe batatas TaxID=748121 RepID=UPI001D053095|nr:uncharacterized protein KVR01_013058 [Diaporthe batatas]KAG8157068.1 hypothetical protein KVR01_013058 [Diaporthe batatas]
MALDIQQRKLLEVTYHAFENAGIPMDTFYGSRTGVYSGSMSDDYQQILAKDIDNLPKYSASGYAKAMVANRISWFYNFHGPSICMDSAGEGFGVVILKRLSDAIHDGDTVRAVVRSSGSNQDGHTQGITQPSREMQAALIRETYTKAGLDTASTRFFEAHGTGTPLGDPIEAEAIGSVFRTSRAPDEPLYVGALKSNVGHLEGGSGIAAVIKTVMVLEKGLIPPNANFERLNPRIDAEFLNLKVSRCLGRPELCSTTIRV